MITAGIRDRVILAVEQCLENYASRPGAVLYNGWGTLRPSNDGLYIMGFNPGGDPDDIKTSVIESLKDLKDKYCSYTDECWRKGCLEDCQKHKGDKLHQKMVKELAEILGYDIREVFAANAIFIRSKEQSDLQESLKLFDRCWPVHQLFLSIVRPRTMLCLGNGEPSSAFAFLRMKLAPNEKPNSEDVKAFSSVTAVSNDETINVRVIGVRHPSYRWFDPGKNLKLYLEKNPHLMAW